MNLYAVSCSGGILPDYYASSFESAKKWAFENADPTSADIPDEGEEETEYGEITITKINIDNEKPEKEKFYFEFKVVNDVNVEIIDNEIN